MNTFANESLPVSNPYAATTLELSPEIKGKSPTFPRWLKVFTTLVYTFFVIATSIALFEIESIIFTGPALLVIGIVFFFISHRWKPLRYIAYGGVGFSIFCVIVINAFSLAPRDAQVPISLLCVVFTARMFYDLWRLKRGMDLATVEPDPSLTAEGFRSPDLGQT